MKYSMQQIFGLAFVTLAFLCGTTLSSAAQDITHPSTTKTVGAPIHDVQTTQVQNAKVIHVSGHEIVVELENGKLELLNLGEDARFQVDGNELTVHELKPGTKLSQEIHTVTTPQEVSTLRTLSGRVWYINAPHYLVVALPKGGHRGFTVPQDAVFNINGEKKSIFGLRKGMDITATVLTVEPLHSITTHTVVTGQAPRPEVTFEGPFLIEEKREVPTMTATVEQPLAKELPNTASVVPLLGTLGIASLTLGAGISLLRSKIRVGR